jgi:hypothetical protein
MNHIFKDLFIQHSLLASMPLVWCLKGDKMSTPKAAQIWKDYLAKPKYPQIDKTYLIRIGTAPTPNAENPQQMIVQSDQGRLLLWSAQFQQLLEVLDGTGFKDTQVVFKRDEKTNRRYVQTVSEALP